MGYTSTHDPTGSSEDSVPWKECSIAEERMRIVSRLLEGEEMSFLCREFGISRKTGYKIFERYKDSGLEALTDRSQRPFRYGNQLPFQVETAIVQLKKEKPHWGARKLRDLLVRKFVSEVKIPAVSTVHAVLDRHGLVQPMNGRRPRAQGTTLSTGAHPNDLWCVEFKGEFMLGDVVRHRYVPLNHLRVLKTCRLSRECQYA